MTTKQFLNSFVLTACCVSGVVACGEDSKPASGGKCEAASDCDQNESTAGFLCLDGACEPCQATGECMQVGYYGADSQCVENRCEAAFVPTGSCPSGDAGCECERDANCVGDLVCDAVAFTCRERSECEVAGCVAGQGCATDALGSTTCQSRCEPGSAWNDAEQRCDAVPSNCLESDPNSINNSCSQLNRTCIEVNGLARCGACSSGSVEVQGTCRRARNCEELDCGTSNRLCGVAGPFPTCQGCEEGFIEGDDGTCRSFFACGKEVTCDSSARCVEPQQGGDAFCQSNDICAAPPTCAAGQVWDQKQRSCSDVCASHACNGDGHTGELAPVLSRKGTCVCETNPGYFVTDGGSKATAACDDDRDGWVRGDAKAHIESDDCVIANNARCALRLVDRFVLYPDAQGAHPISQSLKDYEFTRDLSAVRDGSFGFEGAIGLYESIANDSTDKAYDRKLGDGELPNYASGEADPVNSRAATLAEVNSLTKACAPGRGAKPSQDYNDNGLEDIAEWHGMTSFPVNRSGSDVTPEWMKPFVQFSYFVELHEGWFEAGINGEPGAYHIREKVRAPTAPEPVGHVALKYPPDQNNHWQSCHRRQDSAYGDQPHHGMDFASLAQALGVLGPGHHSQFKCVQLVEELEDKDPTVGYQLALTEISADPDFTLNDCRISNLSRASGPDSVAGSPNPADPVFECSTSTASGLSQLAKEGGVAWVVAEYLDYEQSGDYVRGCINACADQDMLPVQCPGRDGAGSDCRRNTSNFGKLVCGCKDTFSGQNCSVGCPSDHTRRSEETGETYSEFWMCASPSVTTGNDLTSSDGEFELRGRIPMGGAHKTALQSSEFEIR